MKHLNVTVSPYKLPHWLPDRSTILPDSSASSDMSPITPTSPDPSSTPEAQPIKDEAPLDEAPLEAPPNIKDEAPFNK